MAQDQMVTFDELNKHNNDKDVWIVVNGKVFDITEFAPEHPGGADIIYEHAGRDATAAYAQIHAPSLIEKTLDESKHKGKIDASTMPPPNEATASNTASAQESSTGLPPLDTLINIQDFEDAGRRGLSEKAMAFYSGAANDCITRDGNRAMYDRMILRPKLLTNVGKVDVRARVLGYNFGVPFFISPAAMALMSHPEGELDMGRAAVACDMAMCVSTNASYTFAEIAEITGSSYPLFFQLYVNKEREKTEEMIKQVVAAGAKAIVLTIDLPVVGKREADERIKNAQKVASRNAGTGSGEDAKGSGLARAVGSYIDPTITWDELIWLRSLTDVPIVLKGIQTAHDAIKAMQAGCKAIFLSNHGGRALDTAPPVILTLLELHLQCPEIFDKVEILVDGGIRRGTDVLKAMCLGATAVGLGRPFMYAVAYGQEGMVRAINILKDELETAMQQCGLQNLSDASPEYINTGDIDHLVRQRHAHPYAHKIARPKL